jgi:uncharacterized protein (DUF1330 family)
VAACAYLLADIEVLDAADFAAYREANPAIVARFGGEYLALGGAVEVLEGAWQPHRTVMIRFPSMAALRQWYESPEYAAIRPIRERATRTRLVAIEGVATASA